ncbi:hypothetical protein CYLTODRAFT_440956 [Cylindrobasidium torrendii FP15055 ss-10]|uniref:CCZ1/INTU/HSP4 first Longin domain-containing protein n=1 Tax=Cylindrobasidium torrendii FP15055 ss-10 TaxID=1314674 RepID=A0A0D7BMT0_9AGAR|nr:hypothetical protein CYLTODRAFT_440956 [Cylindrobasidium torrendii FP15055 ss-10]
MTRIPPSLLYLTIYNPTLQLSSPPPPDDEDAEEAAHILFYTAKETAVSRDKMLRQVGLAKALINFSNIFTVDDTCNNVHSHARRMLMVSPEPNFWIHACVSLANSSRPSSTGRTRGKPHSKSASIGRSKGKEIAMVTDYDEASVDDTALRGDLLRGYELFKIKHGSMTSVLERSGSEALSLQMERFFTPWAWSWQVDTGKQFGNHLGPQIHPKATSLVKILDSNCPNIPSIIATTSHVIPSTSFLDACISPSISRFLMTLVPPAPQPPTPADPNPSDPSLPNDDAQSGPSSFLSGVNFSTIKLTWPNALTFKGKRAPDPEETAQEPPPGDTTVDKEALVAAVRSEETIIPVYKTEVSEEGSTSTAPVSGTTLTLRGSDIPSEPLRTPPPQSPMPILIPTSVHLAPHGEPLKTERRRMHLYLRYPIAFAFLADDPPEAETVKRMSRDILAGLEADPLLGSSVDTLPSAAKILQPKDRHIILHHGYTRSNEAFESNGEQLYSAQRLFETDDDIQEVFSRGVNPQHWHTARRRWNPEAPSEIYMEVLRKETTLADVDNVAIGVARKFLDEQTDVQRAT